MDAAAHAGRLDHGGDHRRRRPCRRRWPPIRRGGAVALANKEALVCAGEVMLRAVREAGATLLPVDSEHNAIFQALADGNRGAVEKIVLTASGGPFRTASREEMAARHAGGGAAPSGLVDGRQDQHRFAPR